MEELAFRGYIGTRLYGCFKNKLFAISITGLLFTFMHLPFQMLMADTTMLGYIASNWANLIFIFLLHFVFQALYAKHNSIIAPTLFHFIWDYVQWFII
jgi:membrane protease YdiL (CAAX protease family)